MSIVPFIIVFFLILISYLLFRDEENKDNQKIEEEMREWVEKEYLPAQKKEHHEKQIDD